jgi:hypothetical protein
MPCRATRHDHTVVPDAEEEEEEKRWPDLDEEEGREPRR